MSSKITDTEVADLTTICASFPAGPDEEVKRENMVGTLEGLLKSNTEIIVVEGEEGIGKTTLLSQFARVHNRQTISAFVTDSSHYAWDPEMLAQNLHEQIQFALGNMQFRKYENSEMQSLLLRLA